MVGGWHIGVEGIVELPVTYYYQVKIGALGSPRIVDIEGSSLYELKEILDQASERGLCTVNVMMHSFSLSRYGFPDHDVANRLSKMLEYVQGRKKMETATTSEIYRLIKTKKVCAGEPEFVPTTGVVLTYLRAVEDFDKGWKNKAVTLAVPAMLLGSLVSVFLGYRLIRRHTRS